MREPRTQAGSRVAAALMLVVGAGASMSAAAQSSLADNERWRFSASIYGYLPTLSGNSSIPVDSSGTPIDVSVKQIIDALKMTFMGSFSAHNGQWGGFTDVMYLDLGGSKQQSRDFTIGNMGLPAGTTANLGVDLKGLIWTLGAEYRIQAKPELTLDLVAGARLLDLRSTVNWDISGDIGPIQPAGRSGVSETELKLWDGIVGVKGRASFDGMRQWSIPFYLDIGTGQSDLTWQAAGGISYAFEWGELTAMWRYLAYEMKAGNGLQDLSFNGPMFGATFRW